MDKLQDNRYVKSIKIEMKNWEFKIMGVIDKYNEFYKQKHSNCINGRDEKWYRNKMQALFFSLDQISNTYIWISSFTQHWMVT